MDSMSLIVTCVTALVVGLLVGAIPYFLAKKRGIKTVGIICLCCCALGHFIAGLIASIPICLISIIVILVISAR